MADSPIAPQVDTSQVETSSSIGRGGIALLLVLIAALLFVVVKYLMPFLWVDHKNNDTDDKYKKLEDKVTKLENRVTKLEGNNNDEDKGKPNHMGRTPRTSATDKRT